MMSWEADVEGFLHVATRQPNNVLGRGCGRFSSEKAAK